ncbi:Mdg1p LALA0_S12e03884g [Lachancea lanzarotensis]|uniref:LALA0S12e03884g1_1 n=1 Tax=Lachancea lanzarotensis TaxID=1245769 RepID=A0A0C7NG38_9SACH|nr:uncharacterized protein LALA0_S12e03884g [Lachancea lanzarotensis]CEP64656.1 LALA0S12e03884g1_1 [Lachancea lanzarotensis]
MTEYTFTWPKGPNEVLLTGDFDNWTGSLPLVKNVSSGDFAITMPISGAPDDKFRFKFIVDGDWQTSKDYETETSRDGIVNNSVSVAWLASASSKKQNSSKIPEIGLNLVAPEVAAPVLGTQAPQKAQPAPGSNKKNKKKKIQIKRRIRRNKKTGERTVLSEERSEIRSGTDTDTYETEETATATATSREETPLLADDDHTKAVHDHDFQSTVMPSQENQQKTLGEPGIAIMPNPQEIKEFSEIRDVDQNELNERLNRELAAKDDADLGHIVVKPEPERNEAEPVHSELKNPVKEKDLSAPDFPVVLKDDTEKEAVPSTDYSAQEKDLVAPVLQVASTQESVPKAPVQNKEVEPSTTEEKSEATRSGVTAPILGVTPLPLGVTPLPVSETAPPVTHSKEVNALPQAEDADVKALPPAEHSETLESSPAQATAAAVAADVANEAHEKVNSDHISKQEDVLPVPNAPVEGKTASVKTVKDFDISEQPETSTKGPITQEPVIAKNAVETSPADVDIVLVEGELDHLPPKTSLAAEPAALSQAPPSEEEPTGEVRGVPGATDLVGTESEDKFEAEAQAGTVEEAPEVISEEIGVITTPEQEAELIKKTLDPKHGKPGETTELLVVEGDIPPSQVAEYQEASEAAAAEAIQKQKPEEVAIEQAPIVKETVKSQKPATSKPKATPASPEKKKKKKGLFSKIKKIFN